MNGSFILHLDSLDVLDSLTEQQCGRLFKKMRAYNGGKEYTTENDPLINIVFIPFKNQFDRDNIKYENVCKRNRENGSKGGRPQNPNNPVGSLGTQRNPKKPKKPYSDSDSDSDNKNNKQIPQADDYDIFKEMWNNVDPFGVAKKGLPKIVKDTDGLKKRYNIIRKDYDMQDINIALNKYIDHMCEMKPDPNDKTKTYYKHRFTAEEFLKREGGIQKFINK